jgi:hypothetical protein
LASEGCRPRRPNHHAFRCARLLSCRRQANTGNEALGRRGLPPPDPAFRCARLLSCRRLATVGNEALGRWKLPPPHPRFPLRSTCFAGGSLTRATKRLAGGGCRPHAPAICCARLFVLQTARYRGQRSAWQVGAANPTPPLSAALGLSFRRLATACNETLVVLVSLFAAETYNDKTFLYSPPPPRWRIVFIVVGDKKKRNLPLRCARLYLRCSRCRGQRTRPWRSRHFFASTRE